MPNDVNGIYQYTEAEAVPATFSAFLNKLAGSASTAIGTINTFLTTNIADTGWQLLVVPAPSTVTDGLTPMIRRKNGIVYIRGRITQGGGTAFNLPAGYYPAQVLRLPAMVGASGAALTVLVIDPAIGGYTTAGTVVNLAHSWPVM